MMTMLNDRRHELLTRPIRGLPGAMRWIEELHGLGMMFHFDDDPADLVSRVGGPPTFPAYEAVVVRHRVAELRLVEWPEPHGCPIGYALHVMRESDLGAFVATRRWVPDLASDPATSPYADMDPEPRDRRCGYCYGTHYVVEYLTYGPAEGMHHSVMANVEAIGSLAVCESALFDYAVSDGWEG